MLQTLTYTRMTSCGRCNAQISGGWFCQACQSFFAHFAHAGSRVAPTPVAASVISPRRSLRAFAGRCQWLQFTLVDQAIRVVVESNDPACLSQFLSVAASCESEYACAGEYRYAIEARSRAAGDSRYLVRAGRRKLGVAPSRAEAIRRLQSDLNSRIAQKRNRAAVAAPAFQTTDIGARARAAFVLDRPKQFAGGSPPTFFKRRSDS